MNIRRYAGGLVGARHPRLRGLGYIDDDKALPTRGNVGVLTLNENGTDVIRKLDAAYLPRLLRGRYVDVEQGAAVVRRVKITS